MWYIAHSWEYLGSCVSVIYDSKEETCCVSFGIFVKLHDNTVLKRCWYKKCIRNSIADLANYIKVFNQSPLSLHHTLKYLCLNHWTTYLVESWWKTRTYFRILRLNSCEAFALYLTDENHYLTIIGYKSFFLFYLHHDLGIIQIRLVRNGAGKWTSPMILSTKPLKSTVIW